MTTHVETEIEKAQIKLRALRKKKREAERRAAETQARDIGRRLQRKIADGPEAFIAEATAILDDLFPVEPVAPEPPVDTAPELSEEPEVEAAPVTPPVPPVSTGYVSSGVPYGQH